MSDLKLKLMAIESIAKEHNIGKDKIEVFQRKDKLTLSADCGANTYVYDAWYDEKGKPKISLQRQGTEEQIPPVEFDAPYDKGQANGVLNDLNYTDVKKHPFTRVMEEIVENKEKEIEELHKIIDTLEIKNNQNYDLLKEENAKLKKENEELKRQLNRDRAIYQKFADYGKELERRYSPKITQEQIDLIRKLLAEGKTESEIVKMTDTSKGTVWRVKRGLL